jgi:hypothetical protein
MLLVRYVGHLGSATLAAGVISVILEILLPRGELAHRFPFLRCLLGRSWDIW